MLNDALLKEIGFAEEDIPYILECNRKYAPALAPLAAAYRATFGSTELLPYPGEEREEAYQRAKDYVAAVIALFPEEENPHILNLLAWLQLIPYLEARYAAHGFSRELLIASLSDFPEKVKECKSVYGVCGVFSRWFFLFFDMKVFSLGRLHYEIAALEADRCTLHGMTLRRGDTVLSCHIPAKGPLTPAACLESLQLAGEFFRKLFPGKRMPVVCHSWLLYPPYLEKVFPAGSNLSRFAEMFHILFVDQVGDYFPDCWRVFGKMHQKDLSGFPADTRLRRSFLAYMENGGDFGSGYGIFLFNTQNQQPVL